MCPPRAETQAVRRFTLLLYCAVNKLLIHLISFVGDALHAYLLQKTAWLQWSQNYVNAQSIGYLTDYIKIRPSSVDLFTYGHSLKLKTHERYIEKQMYYFSWIQCIVWTVSVAHIRNILYR